MLIGSINDKYLIRLIYKQFQQGSALSCTQQKPQQAQTMTTPPKSKSRAKSKSRFLKNKSQSMSQDLQNFNSSFSHSLNEEDQEVQTHEKKQMGIFEEFKIKYDEVRKDNETKRKELEELSRVNKRQEIQLLNMNVDFYDKEIKRLRQEVEKLQQSEEDFKDKYFQAQNKSKELEASVSLKEQATKKMIKSVEKEKVQNVELKHKMKEKQNQLMSIIKSLEVSSEEASERFTVSEKKLNEVQNSLKTKNREFDQLKMKYEKLQKNKEELSVEQKKVIEKYQVLIKSTKHSLEETEDINRKYRNQIISLREVIEELKHQQQNQKSIFEFETSQKMENLKRYREVRVIEAEGRKLAEQNDSLLRENQEKASMLKNIKEKLSQLSEDRRKDQLGHEEKVIELQNKKNAIEKHYQTVNLGLNKELQILRAKGTKSQPTTFEVQLPKGTARSKDASTVINAQFQQLLDSQIKEGKQLRSQLNEKIQEIYKLKSQLEDHKIKESLLNNQIEILKKKSQAGHKNSQIEHQIQLQNVKNDLEALKRKYSTLEARLASRIKEVKQKDSFIANNVMGKSRPEDGALILAEIQRVFECDYVNKLQEANSKIKQLQEQKETKK